jgi:hypothetical protein
MATIKVDFRITNKKHFNTYCTDRGVLCMNWYAERMKAFFDSDEK